MLWIRRRLTLLTSVGVSAYISALTASSIAICCLSHHKVESQMPACPMHRAADDSCSMTDCPMHRGASTPKHDVAEQNPGSGHQRHAVRYSPPKPANQAQLTCRDGGASPALVLSVPGFLLPATSLKAPLLKAVPLIALVLAPVDRSLPVLAPPPRG